MGGIVFILFQHLDEIEASTRPEARGLGGVDNNRCRFKAE